MKLAIVSTLVATASAASHARMCTKGCSANSCDADEAASVLTTYDKVVAANKGAVDSGANSLHAAQAIAKHVPFVCKVKKSRRERELAGHVQQTLRVGVAGEGGSMTTLHPMKADHWIDYITVVDASSGGHRQLAAHAKTLMYVAGAQSDAVKGTNACIEFDLLKAAKVTKIKAGEHCNLHGLWWSEDLVVADLPDCDAAMSSDNDARRQLAGHAGKWYVT